MSDTQLYINDFLVDLSDDSAMALTFQINNLADLKNQQGNTSNQFKLPLTQRNRRILGFPDDITITTDLPYTKYQARVIVSGIEVINAGIAELNSVEDGMANITVLSGNVDFFDAIDGKLYDMGDSSTVYGADQPFIKPVDYSHVWSLANVVASQTKTEGWIWPVVDYGKIPTVATDGEILIDVRDMRPGFFIKTAIDVMVASVGYRAKGSLLDHPLYPKLIAQFSNDNLEHGSDYQNKPDTTGINVALAQNLNVIHPNADHAEDVIYWPVINSDPSQRFLAGYVYNAPEITSVTATVKIPKLYLWGHVTPTERQSTVEIIIILSTPSTGDQTPLTSFIFDFSAGFNRISGSGSSIIGDTTILNTTISTEIDMAAGQQLAVRYAFHGDTPSQFAMYAGASFEVKTNNVKVDFGQVIQPERIFPDISMKDLLKDTLQRFGIICQTDVFNRTINFASFADIIANVPVAKDWTDKCVMSGKSVYFQLGGYGQANNLKYKTDDNVKPDGLADDVINIDDKTLDASVDLFESQFAPSLNREFIGGTIAVINKVEVGGDTYTIGTSPRILIDQKRDLIGGRAAVRFTDGVNSVLVNSIVSVPYFDKPDAPALPAPFSTASLAWSVLRKDNYQQQEHILKRSKKLVRFFMLSPRDIQELDLLVPVFLQQDGAYFYINKIDSWIRGVPTKVELIRL